MSFRSIVVDACPKSDVVRTLELAREIATAFDARLLVAAYAWPKSSVMDVVSGNTFAIEKQSQEMRYALDVTQEAFRRVFAGTKLDVEWSAGISDPTFALRESLLTADLLITRASESGVCLAARPLDLVFAAGVPVLRLGSAAVYDHFSNILVAWKDSPQARRALHGALPILKRADKVTVIGIGSEISVTRLEAVVDHLRLHNVKSRHLHISHSEQNVGADLIAHSKRENADMIVAGCYSRSAITELILGGVTRDLLKTPDLSWLMAN